VAQGGKRETGKRRTLKVWKALQFSKAKDTEQRSRQFTAAWTHPQTRTATIRLMILTPAQTPSSRPSPPQQLTATKWNVRVVVVPSAAQIFRWSCVFFNFYVTLCTVINDFLHWTTWSFSDSLCFVVRVAINFVYVGNNLVWNRIHAFAILTEWCVFCWLLMHSDFAQTFNSLCVSNVYFFSCMNLLQHIKYYQFLYVFGTELFYNTGTIGVP